MAKVKKRLLTEEAFEKYSGEIVKAIQGINSLTYAEQAQLAASEANKSKLDAETKAGEAGASATNAKASAEDAKKSAEAAKKSAEAAAKIVDVGVDPTLSVEGAAADSKAVGETIGELKKALYIKTYNIFDVDFLPRAFISLDGTHAGEIFLDNNDNYSATNETIEALGNAKYTISNGNESIPYPLGLTAVLYDNNMKYLGVLTCELTNRKKYFTFTTLSNTKYLRFMCRATGKGADIPNIKKWQLNEGDVRPYLKPYEFYISSNYIGEELTNADITNPQVKSFIESVDYSGQDYTITHVGKYSAPPAYYRKDCCFPMVVKWKSNNEVKNQILYISKTSSINILDNVNTKQYDVACGTSDFCVYNLIPNKKYYYKICGIDFHNNPIIIKEDSFTTSGNSRMLNIDGLKNVRDLGGLVCWRKRLC